MSLVAEVRARLAEAVAEDDYGPLYATADTDLARLCDRVEALQRALVPFARFSRSWAAQPILGVDDVVYSIHRNTEWEAELRRSDCDRAAAALGETPP